jgi:hypothetical protein
MEKTSKRYVKPLILALIIVLVVSSMIVTLFVVNLAKNGVDHSSGIFTMKFQSHTRATAGHFPLRAPKVIAPFSTI